MQQPTIAHLPINPYDNEEPPQQVAFVPVENAVLNTVDYSDKSFIVFGPGTKVHKENIKALGGKYNGRLGERPGFRGGPAWIFPTKLKNTVFTYLNSANAAPAPQAGIPNQGTQTGLPTIIARIPPATQTYQTVKWKVYRPAEGMRVSVKGDGTEFVGTVLQTIENNGIVETAEIDVNGQISGLVICSGKWQVLGYMADHSVFFGEPRQRGPAQPVQTTHQAPIQTQVANDPNYNYEDIAGI